MTDQAAGGEIQAPRMNILGQFIRDMSFENVAAQKGTEGNVQPDIQVQVNLDARKRDAASAPLQARLHQAEPGVLPVDHGNQVSLVALFDQPVQPEAEDAGVGVHPVFQEIVAGHARDPGVSIRDRSVILRDHR